MEQLNGTYRNHWRGNGRLTVGPNYYVFVDGREVGYSNALGTVHFETPRKWSKAALAPLVKYSDHNTI